jgi:hypothetical protein
MKRKTLPELNSPTTDDSGLLSPSEAVSLRHWAARALRDAARVYRRDALRKRARERRRLLVN